MGYRKVILSLSGVTLLSVVLTFASRSLAQTPSPTWVNSPLSLEKIRDLSPSELTPYSINGNRDCDDRKIITRPFRIVPFQTEQSHISCVVDANYGSVSTSGYLQRQGTTISGQTKLSSGASTIIVPIPRSPTGLRIFGSLPVGNNLQFMPSFEATLKSSAVSTGEVTHTITPTSPVNFKDRSGQLLSAHTDSLAFSSNGQWMVVDVPNIGMARVDLYTFTVLPFGDPFNYNIGVAPGIQSAISPDGRYAVLYSKSFGRFKIYDLSTCATVPNFIVGKVNCQSIDLNTFVQNQISNFEGLGTLRFINSGAISFYATSKIGGVPKTAQYVMSLLGTPIFNFGYLALGDSYASGEGAYNYKALSDTKDNKCHLSLLSYPYLLGRDLGLGEYESVACSGAKILDIEGWEKYNEKDAQAAGKIDDSYTLEIFSSFLPGYRAQLGFIERNRPEVTTISAVGNDIGFANKLVRCLEPDTCFSSYEDRLEIVREVNEQFPRLVGMYNQIKSDNNDPRAKIYAIGYPQIAKPGGDCALNVRFNDAELEFAERLIDYLNSIIRQAAKHSGISYVDISNALTGYRLCETDSWDVAVNGLTAGNDKFELFGGPIGNESYHPNAFGHSLIAQKIAQQTSNFTQPMPAPDPSALPPVESNNLPLLQKVKSNRQVDKLNYDEEASNDVVYRNGVWRLVIETFKFSLNPLSTFKAWLNSDPLFLGSFTSDAQGGLSSQVSVPPSTPTGFHTLHIYGKNVSGENVDIYKTVYVAASSSDLDGDGIANPKDPCVVITPSGIDSDKDGIDDACDPFIDQAPLEVASVLGLSTSSQSTPDSLSVLQPVPPSLAQATEGTSTQVAGATTTNTILTQVYPANPQQEMRNEEVLVEEVYNQLAGGAVLGTNIKNTGLISTPALAQTITVDTAAEPPPNTTATKKSPVVIYTLLAFVALLSLSFPTWRYHIKRRSP